MPPEKRRALALHGLSTTAGAQDRLALLREWPRMVPASECRSLGLYQLPTTAGAHDGFALLRPRPGIVPGGERPALRHDVSTASAGAQDRLGLWRPSAHNVAVHEVQTVAGVARCGERRARVRHLRCPDASLAAALALHQHRAVPVQGGAEGQVPAHPYRARTGPARSGSWRRVAGRYRGCSGEACFQRPQSAGRRGPSGPRLCVACRRPRGSARR